MPRLKLTTSLVHPPEAKGLGFEGRGSLSRYLREVGRPGVLLSCVASFLTHVGIPPSVRALLTNHAIGSGSNTYPTSAGFQNGIQIAGSPIVVTSGAAHTVTAFVS